MVRLFVHWWTICKDPAIIQEMSEIGPYNYKSCSQPTDRILPSLICPPPLENSFFQQWCKEAELSKASMYVSYVSSGLLTVGWSALIVKIIRTPEPIEKKIA